MANWYKYDAESAAGTLPPSLATAYAAWLTAEVRLARLGVIASGVVSDFRTSVAADADTLGSTDPALVPASCVRHVAAVTWYTLAQEMGADPEAYRSAWQDSEIYLRQLYADLRQNGGTASGASGTPRYGVVGGVSGSGGSHVSGVIRYYTPYSPINYGPPAL